MRYLTFVIVGGGPTGVEMAGAVAEIRRYALRRDFRHIDPREATVLLLEGGPRLLPAYPPELGEKAKNDLRRLGVEVRTETLVTDIQPGSVSARRDGRFPRGRSSGPPATWPARCSSRSARRSTGRAG